MYELRYPCLKLFPLNYGAVYNRAYIFLDIWRLKDFPSTIASTRKYAIHTLTYDDWLCIFPGGIVPVSPGYAS